MKKNLSTSTRVLLAATFVVACGAPEDIDVAEDEVIAKKSPRPGNVVMEKVGSYCEEPSASSGWELVMPTSAVFEDYCTYEWRDDYASIDYDEIESWGLDYSVDPALVRPLNGDVSRGPQTPVLPLIEARRPSLVAAYRRRMQAPQTISGTTIEIALVDTTPENAPQPRSVHAISLERLIEETVCDRRSQCAANVTKYLALPRIGGLQSDLVNGGHYGTLMDLANGIVDAVDNSPINTPLIVNLSVGWDESLVPVRLPSDPVQAQLNPPANTNMAVLAVHRAVLYARCSGALILAAAGNDPLVRRRPARMYPAAFTTRRAPTSGECATIFGTPGATNGGPLVYAVGGVDYKDDPIPNAISIAMPELVAPADTVIPARGGAAMTGTSVAAAGASAAAAIAWALDTSRTSEDIYRALLNTAVSVEATVTMGGVEGDAANRINACSAAQSICDSNPTCASFACPPPPRSMSDGRPTKAETYAALARTGAPLLSISGIWSGSQEAGLCNTVRSFITSISWRCPVNAPPVVNNLAVGPQPLTPICPACTLIHDQGEIAMVMQVRTPLPNGEVTNPMLYLKDAMGGEETLPLPAPIPEGLKTTLHIGPTSLTAPIVKAILNYEYEEGGNTFSSGEPIDIGAQ